MTASPAWLQAHLVAEGHITETGLTRTPRARTCHSCGHLLLAAIDDSGFDALTWARPTTTLGEVLAVAHGRRTWHVNAYGGLRARTGHTVAAKPADRVPVHVEHHCGDPPPPVAPTTPQPVRRRYADGDPPPY